MRQVISGHNGAEVSGSISPFASLFGVDGNLSVGSFREIPFAAAGTLSRFYFKISEICTQTKIIRFRNVTTAAQIELIIPVGQTEVIDDSSTLSFSAGDAVRLQITNGDSGNPGVRVSWSCLFTGTNNNEAVSGGTTDGGVDEGEDGFHFFPLGPEDSKGSATEAERVFVAPTAFTLKSFYVRLAGSSGTGGSTRTVSIYKNGVQEASTALSFADADTSMSTTGLSVAFEVGDTMSVRHDATGNLTTRSLTWGFMYNPTIDGESLIGGKAVETLSTTLGTTEYQSLNGDTSQAWTTTDSMQVQQASHSEHILKKFRVRIASSPGTDQTRQFRIRHNSSSGTPSIVLSGSSTEGVDNSNTEFISDRDTWGIEHTVISSGVGACAHSRWSAVSYVDPAGGETISEAISKYNTGTNGKIRACPSEGSGNVATMDFQAITDNRTYTYPNKSGTVALNGGTLTATRIPFANSDGNLVDDADLTFVTDTLSATKIASSSLTSGRVPIASTAGLLVDDADLTFSGDTLTATKFSGAHNGTVGATTPASGVFTSLQADSITNDTGLAAGVYTPTRSAESNLDSNVTTTEAQYLRVGNTVTVSGRFTADPTAAGAASFEITLPVASNLGAAEDVAGVAFAGGIAGQGAEIIGVAANDTAKIQWIAVDTTSQTWGYVFTYQII